MRKVYFMQLSVFLDGSYRSQLWQHFYQAFSFCLPHWSRKALFRNRCLSYAGNFLAVQVSNTTDMIWTGDNQIHFKDCIPFFKYLVLKLCCLQDLAMQTTKELQTEQ